MAFASKSFVRLGSGFLLLILCAALLAPIWIVRYPPLVDYPNHLASAFVLIHLSDPQFQFSRFYRAEWKTSPYWDMDLALLGFGHFMPIELAGRLFLSLCLVAVPLGPWLFVRTANPGNDSLALWSLLVSYNYFLFYGFLNFELSLALCFLAAALWLRGVERPDKRAWMLLLVIVTTLYFAHLAGFVVAGFLVAGYWLLARRRLAEMVPTSVLFLPGICFYLLWRFGAQRDWPVEFRPFHQKFHALAPFLQGYSPWLDKLSWAILAICALAAWWRNPDWRWNRPWALLTLGLFGLYWVLPESYGTGWLVDQRILPFVFLLLPAVANVGRRGRVLGAVAIALFLVRTAVVAYHFVSQQPELTSLAQCFSKTPANATVLPVVQAKDDESFLRPYPHFWAYGVIERGWLSPYLFAQGNVAPLKLQPGVYLEEGFWDLEYDNPPDWDDVREHYEYVWAYNVEEFSSDLEAMGHAVCESSNFHLFRLEKPATEILENKADRSLTLWSFNKETDIVAQVAAAKSR